MKIVIDGRIYGRKWTGIGNYTEEVIKNLQTLDSENEYFVLLRQEIYDSWNPKAPNFHKVLADYKPYGFKEQILLPLRLYLLRPDLVHFCHFTVPLAYFGRYVVTVHDLILIEYKNIRGEGIKKLVYEVKYWLMRLVIRHAVKVSRGIITPTAWVKDQIVKRYHVRDSKVTVTHEAADPRYAEATSIDALGIHSPFLLYVGNTYEHKNVARLIRAFVKLKHHGLQLVIVGKKDYFLEQLQQMAKDLELGDRVIFTGFVDGGQLTTLYQKAEMFVFPSLSEGFGLPALEAMAQGTPVLSSNASCMPEVYGDAAAYFDPLDEMDITAKIDELLDDDAKRKALAEAGPKHVANFTWDKTAAATLDVYKKII